MNAWLPIVLDAIVSIASTAAKALREDWDDAPRRVLEVWSRAESDIAKAVADEKARDKFGDG